MRSPDVLVIGAGVVGCAIAYRLAQRGLGVLVLERSSPGAEASSVAGGILAPLIEHGGPSAATRLGVSSRELHAGLAAELREDTGIDVGYRRSGAMMVALGESEAEELTARAPRIAEAGRVEVLSGEEARRREPALAPCARTALDLPEEAQVDPALLVRALAVAAERAGAVFRLGTSVRGVVVDGDRVRGVLTDTESIESRRVVVAAGAWTALLPGLDTHPGAGRVRPVRGQILTAETRPPIVRRILYGSGGYVVPRPDGRVLCGATMEDAGFRREVTLGGIRWVIERALRLVPALAQASLLSHAVNFRPASPDGLPLVGPAGPEGLWLATGHHRNGILLAPITAALITAALVGDAPPFLDAEALDPRRFAQARTGH